ncbi:MAG: HD domain-containing protein, partial [Desulfovibrio sp.]|nr:HD domain-containing protein [Desulfovibrio sp.]
IRLAAMLHDIGKVGISDLILKKPGKLTDDEFAVMRGHAAIGAAILAEDLSDISALSQDIALHHHQKWNGRGYPAIEGKTPAGESIPLGARMVAVADVFDALVSPRCYKKPWSFAEALELLRKEAGEHFDPHLVECMVEIRDLLPLIYERFPDVPQKEDGAAR